MCHNPSYRSMIDIFSVIRITSYVKVYTRDQFIPREGQGLYFPNSEFSRRTSSLAIVLVLGFGVTIANFIVIPDLVYTQGEAQHKCFVFYLLRRVTSLL